MVHIWSEIEMFAEESFREKSGVSPRHLEMSRAVIC